MRTLSRRITSNTQIASIGCIEAHEPGLRVLPLPRVTPNHIRTEYGPKTDRRSGLGTGEVESGGEGLVSFLVPEQAV